MPGFDVSAINAQCHDSDAFTTPSKYSGYAANVETARAHRYKFEILKPLEHLLLYAYKAGRPSYEVDDMVIHSAQDEIYRPGKTHLKTIDISFYEYLSPMDPPFTDTTASQIYKWWAESMVDITTSLHKPLDQYMFECQLDMLDGVGMPVWTYFMYDCWPLKVTPSELSYADTGIADITVTLRYSKFQEKLSGVT